ncbi:MAG: hypothetical protein AB7S41_14925 [Parvibaculaceae bacterium]
MKRHITLICLALAGMLPGPPASSQEASDWPCVQRKVSEISLAAAWQGPDFDPTTLKQLQRDPAVANLADLLAARRTTEEEARKAIADFAATAGDTKHDKILAVVSVLFERLNADRADVMAGIERYGRKQKALAERVRDDNAKLDALREETNADATKVSQLNDQVSWDMRIFDERQKSLRYVCEVPQMLEQRLFSLSKLLQAALS